MSICYQELAEDTCCSMPACCNFQQRIIKARHMIIDSSTGSSHTQLYSKLCRNFLPHMTHLGGKFFGTPKTSSTDLLRSAGHCILFSSLSIRSSASLRRDGTIPTWSNSRVVEASRDLRMRSRTIQVDGRPQIWR